MPDTPMSSIPVWDDPHSFGLPGRGSVFSYGLLIAELEPRRLPDSAYQARLGERWGRPVEVVTLARRLTPATAHGGFSMDSAEPLRPFRESLIEAGKTGDRVPDGFEESMRRFLDFVKRPDQWHWRWRVVGPTTLEKVRAERYGDLLERLALEFDHLVMRRPKLARCKDCGRVFVPLRPARPEVHCRANLWRPGSPPVLLESCAPIDVNQEAARRREEKRLHQAYRRARAAFGENAPATKKAKSAWRRWQQNYRPVRGPGRPAAPEVTYQPEGETDG